MKNGLKILSCAVAGVCLAFAGSARASLIVNSLTDTGTLKVQTFTPPSITSVTLVNPYGAPPVPTVVPLANGFALNFTVTSDFMANSTSGSVGKLTTMDGALTLNITFSSPVNLTTNLYEDGIYSQNGSGAVNVTGSLSVVDAGGIETTHHNSFPSPVLNSSGTWSIFDQVTGFTGSFSTYNISIDNTLLASALITPAAGNPTGAGGAYIAKKDFTLVFTTDGSSGSGQTPSPEPASLGVMALGGLALLARRRK